MSPVFVEAVCVGCGCSDSIACAVGCSWLWVDRRSGRGRCSGCRPPSEGMAALEQAVLTVQAWHERTMLG